MNTRETLFWVLRIIALIILYIPIWVLGAMPVAGHLPDTPSEPGLADGPLAMFLLAAINSLLVVGLILSSRWRGWHLALPLALAYYGSFTFITQVETWYFLTHLTVSPELLPRLFIMGLSVPFLFIPLAILICGRWKETDEGTGKVKITMSNAQWILKLAVIAVVYIVLYWCAGYFIAWQNPELRAFYGSPGQIVPFWEHTLATFSNSPDLILLQFVRGVFFAIVSIPVIRGSTMQPWLTALLVGLLLAVPHLGHILPNPIMPVASVRFSHMLETFTSTFLFGLIIVWLLHRRHENVADLLFFSKKRSQQ